jgi:uncharacterized caspase-like protein
MARLAIAQMPNAGNGPFAKAFVTALDTPKITVAKLFDLVNGSVAATTKGKQVPWIAASSAIDVPLWDDHVHSFALVIGNGAYKHIPPLKGAPRDGKAVGQELEAIGFKTRTPIDADPAVLTKEIDQFFQSLGNGDSAVLYYSGHGFSFNGVAYLPPLDAEATNETTLRRSSIPVATLMDRLSKTKAARKLLILDTHYPSLPGSGR